jgi:hypothetical protein
MVNNISNTVKNVSIIKGYLLFIGKMGTLLMSLNILVLK